MKYIGRATHIRSNTPANQLPACIPRLLASMATKVAVMIVIKAPTRNL